MTRSGLIPLLACLGELLLLVLVLWRGKRSPMWAPLVGLGLVAFGWNFTGIAHALTGDDRWRWIDASISPATAAVAFHLVLAFTGQRERLRTARLLGYAWQAPLGLYALVALLVPSVRWLYTSGIVPTLHLIGAGTLMSYGIVLLILHDRATRDPSERGRTRLLLGAVAIATPLALTEVLNELGYAVPHLGSLGMLIGNALVVLMALRLRVFEGGLRPTDALIAAVLAALGVGLYLAVLEVFEGETAPLVLATATVTLLLAGGTTHIWRVLRAERERLEGLAQLGLVSAQLSHDLKNPLAALRGAAQFLEGELKEGRPLDEHRGFLTLIVDQADRMQQVIDDYRRLGRVEVRAKRVELNAFVRRHLALQAFAVSRGDVRVNAALASELVPCEADEELLSQALHNLLRNACEAMPEGGELTVETREQDGQWVVLAVVDTGVGMDARTRERAFDTFFTTRASGSGLGLSWVRRVATAHGGKVSLESVEGQGTRVEIWLPAASSVARVA